MKQRLLEGREPTDDLLRPGGVTLIVVDSESALTGAGRVDQHPVEGAEVTGRKAFSGAGADSSRHAEGVEQGPHPQAASATSIVGVEVQAAIREGGDQGGLASRCGAEVEGPFTGLRIERDDGQHRGKRLEHHATVPPGIGLRDASRGGGGDDPGPGGPGDGGTGEFVLREFGDGLFDLPPQRVDPKPSRDFDRRRGEQSVGEPGMSVEVRTQTGHVVGRKGRGGAVHRVHRVGVVEVGWGIRAGHARPLVLAHPSDASSAGSSASSRRSSIVVRSRRAPTPRVRPAVG